MKDRASFDRMHAATRADWAPRSSLLVEHETTPGGWWRRVRPWRRFDAREPSTPETAAPRALGLGSGRRIAVPSPPAATGTLLDQLARRLSREQGLAADLLRVETVSVARGRAATCVLADADRPRFVARIPLSGRALGRCEENLLVLGRIQACPAIPPELGCPIPRPVGRLDVEGQPVFVETAVPGMSEADRGRSRRQRARRHALAFLAKLHAAARQDTLMDESAFEERIGHYCDRLATAFGGSAESATLRGIKSRLRAGLEGRRWPLVPEHGDFHLGNCLFEDAGARLSGVIDWDLGACPGLPVLDALHLLVTSEGKGRLEAATAAMLLGRGLAAEAATLLSEYVARIDIEAESLPSWSLLYVLVKLLVPAITREGESRERWLETVVAPTLRELGSAALS